MFNIRWRTWCIRKKCLFEFFYFLNKIFITLKIEHFSINVEGQWEHLGRRPNAINLVGYVIEKRLLVDLLF